MRFSEPGSHTSQKLPDHGEGRGIASVHNVVTALSETIGRQRSALFTCFDRLQPTVQYSSDDEQGIDVWARLTKPARDIIACDRLGIQVKSSSRGEIDFLRRELKRTGEDSKRTSLYDRALLLLNGQREKEIIQVHAAVQLIGLVGLEPDPNDQRVRNHLYSLLHPSFASAVCQHMREHPRELAFNKNIYDPNALPRQIDDLRHHRDPREELCEGNIFTRRR